MYTKPKINETGSNGLKVKSRIIIFPRLRKKSKKNPETIVKLSSSFFLDSRPSESNELVLLCVRFVFYIFTSVRICDFSTINPAPAFICALPSFLKSFTDLIGALVWDGERSVFDFRHTNRQNLRHFRFCWT